MSTRQERAEEVLRAYSPKLFRLFARYLDRYFASNFNSVRVLAPGLPALAADRPVVFFCNHAGWWDPILYLLVAARLVSDRRGFGPIDAQALQKYRFLRRIGLFPVEQDSRRGAIDFLVAAKVILAVPGTSLWLTPQGQFCDARERPVRFKAGLAHLVRDMPAVQLVPFAAEYPFWSERRPEALVHFGPVIDGTSFDGQGVEVVQSRLEQALTEALDRLAQAAIARDETAFQPLVVGKAGVSPVYDAWRWMKAKIAGRDFSSAHKD